MTLLVFFSCHHVTHDSENISIELDPLLNAVMLMNSRGGPSFCELNVDVVKQMTLMCTIHYNYNVG